MNIRDVPLEKGPIRGRHAELTQQVKSYRALVIFGNRKSGSKSLMHFFAGGSVKEKEPVNEAANFNCRLGYDWEEIYTNIENMGYTVERSRELIDQNHLFDEETGIFYDVAKQFKDSNKEYQDVERLRLAVRTIMSYRVVMRVIPEEVPWELCAEILECLNYFHYSTVLLYRRNSYDRLVSLWYHTNKDKSLDVDKLLSNEKYTRDVNVKLWAAMKKASCRYASVSTEDIFSVSDSSILHITFRFLYYALWDFTNLINYGIIVYRDEYKNMKGIDELKERLPEIGKKPTFSNVHVDI